MMIVDASAIIAIMFEEAEAPDCMAALQMGASCLISAVNYVEVGDCFRLIRDAPHGEFNVLPAEALDRISRDQADVATLHHRRTGTSLRRCVPIPFRRMEPRDGLLSGERKP